jgi:hypothetical protein
MRLFCGLFLTAGVLSIALSACGGGRQGDTPPTCQGAVSGAGSAVQVTVGCTSSPSPSNASPLPSASTAPLPSASIAPIIVSPPSVALTLAQTPSQVITVTESNGAATTFYVVSANTAVATVSPSSGSGSFTVTEVTAGNTTLTITDPNGNTISVAVFAQ